MVSLSLLYFLGSQNCVVSNGPVYVIHYNVFADIWNAVLKCFFCFWCLEVFISKYKTLSIFLDWLALVLMSVWRIGGVWAKNIPSIKRLHFLIQLDKLLTLLREYICWSILSYFSVQVRFYWILSCATHWRVAQGFLGTFQVSASYPVLKTKCIRRKKIKSFPLSF